MIETIRKNPLLLTDCYNLSHSRLKTESAQSWEVSHMYNRAKGMILYGFQEIVTDILSIRITQAMIEEADEVARKMNLVFPRELWERVVKECDGCMPLQVQCLPEGSWCPARTPFAQIRNTVEGFGDLVTWLEGIFMMAYFPSTCATRALEMRKYLEAKKKQYNFDDNFLWRFHSFGFRGHKSLEDAYWAGTAWSLFLNGTDDFHIGNHVKDLPIGSIPALAHKVTEGFDNEYDSFTRAIEQVAGKENIVALVIDTYDSWNVINNYVVPLSKYAKEKGVHIVFRPDSGDIFEQAVSMYKIVKENNFDNVNVIIGEGMSFENAKKFDKKLEDAGVPLNFVNYGIGAGFYKDIERDTLGWAMKTAFSNGKPRMKLVKTNTFKQSIPNIISLKYIDNELVVCDGDCEENEFDVIYDYNEDNGRYIDFITPDHYLIVSHRAMHQDNTQNEIVLSKETQALIQTFKKKY